MKLSGWGRFPVADCAVSSARDETDVTSAMADGALIARGNGRAYGDSALNREQTLTMRGMGRMLSFDASAGVLVAEAGVLLEEVIATFLPRGWFPAVTPGTKLVTLGGMIAADVHGKNHHGEGSMRNCVDWLDLAGADGMVRRCSRSENAELFEWTLGGMGLTGVILRAAIRLRAVESAWIRQTTIPADNLAAAMAAFEASQDATYSVAWIDCLAKGKALGRSLVMLGEHAKLADLPPAKQAAPFAGKKRPKLSVPIDFPVFALNGLTVRLFNQLYYAAGKAKGRHAVVDWDSYFYPLDAIRDWNRIYGKPGFAQFQCALPLERSEAGLTALLEAISRAGLGSFLAVLKRFGEGGGGLSFPMPGYTLALDFPVSERTRALFETLDRIVIAHGGRQYLAKDSRMSAATLSASDNRVEAFRAYRDASGAKPRFRSLQSERLGL